MALDFKEFQKMKWYYQVLIVASVCSSLLGLVWYQFLTPINEEIVARDKEVTKLQGEVSKALEQQKRFKQFKDQVAGLEVKLQSLKTVLPLQKETDDLLRSVQDAVTTSGMRLLRFEPRTQTDREVYFEFPVNMEIVGTYHSVGEYLTKIRQLPRIVNISGLRLNSRAGGADPTKAPSIGATYVATTFIYKEEPPAAAAPAKAPAK